MSRSSLPKDGSSRVVFTIHNRETGHQEGCYDRSYGDQYEWEAPEGARASNWSDIYQDRKVYQVKRWKVTYELLSED